MDSRLRDLRGFLELSQEEFGKKINLSKPTISAFETKTRPMTDRVVSDICSVFNVNEDWLRSGQGEMFVEASNFSLSEYAEKSNLSELEYDLIKGYMDLDVETRKEIIATAKSIFDKHSEVVATKEETQKDIIDAELESYRLELEAEQKGEISLASDDIEGKVD